MNERVEIWKEIIGYEGLYEISNLGRVKSLSRKKYLKPYCDKGYYHLSLCKNNRPKMYLVHRLIGIHFIPNPQNLPQINHKDGDKSNNNIDNLEWVTISENINHAIHVLKIKRKGEHCNRSFLKEEDIRNIRKLHEETDITNKELGEMYNTCRSNIEKIIKRKYWNHI